jgi:hypothetical protein
MAYIALLFAALFGFNVLLAWGLIWARRETFLRHIAVPYVVAVLPFFVFVATETLGRHKPSVVAWREMHGESQIIAYKAVPDEAIYLYVDTGENEPRAISLPWSAQTARKLYEAMEGDNANGAILKGRGSSWSPEGYVEHAPPPKPLPPKNVPRGSVLPPT